MKKKTKFEKSHEINLNVRFLNTCRTLFDHWNCEQRCQTITTDTLIVHGMKDSVVDVQEAKQLNNLIKKSQCEIIDDAGHLIPITHSIS